MDARLRVERVGELGDHRSRFLGVWSLARLCRERRRSLELEVEGDGALSDDRFPHELHGVALEGRKSRELSHRRFIDLESGASSELCAGSEEVDRFELREDRFRVSRSARVVLLA